jgi:hypothetical protein
MKLIVLTKFMPDVDVSELLRVGKNGDAMIVFEPTMIGYYDAINWLRQNGSVYSNIYRLVIPFSNYGDDVGDYLLCNNLDSKVYEKTSDIPSTHKYLTKLVSLSETSTSTWPCVENNSLWAFSKSREYLVKILTTPNQITGLSQLHVYSQNFDESLEIVQILCVLKFKITLADIKYQYLPRLIPKPDDIAYIPYALVNGTFPFDKNFIKDIIREALKTNYVSACNLDNVNPSHKGYSFIKNNYVWGTYFNLNDYNQILQHPYGYKMICDLVKINPYLETENFIYEPIDDKDVCNQFYPVVWNPEFVDGYKIVRHETPNDYLSMWLTYLDKVFSRELYAKYEYDMDFLRMNCEFLNLLLNSDNLRSLIKIPVDHRSKYILDRINDAGGSDDQIFIEKLLDSKLSEINLRNYTMLIAKCGQGITRRELIVNFFEH